MTIDLSQMHNQVVDIKLRTRSSIELTTRLIDQSFVRLKISRGLVYQAQQSKERLDRVLKAMDPGNVRHEVSATPVVAKKRPMLESSKSAGRIICGHCEGILFNKKAYRVWTEDDGVILLDMVVCYTCKLEAQKLGLKTERVKDRYASKAKS
jgi:RNase P subunit RPR2